MAAYNRTAIHFNFLLLAFTVFILLFSGCNSNQRNQSHAAVSQYSIDKGKELAHIYCQSCHQLPDPREIDASTWETGALPAMGPKLGIFNYKGRSYDFHGDDNMKGPGFSAIHSLITTEQWQNIFDYYTATSPDKLPDQERKTQINMDLSQFRPEIPGLNYKAAHTSFVHIGQNETATPVIISDANTHKTYFINKSLNAFDSAITNGPIVNFDFYKNSMLACNIGILIPNDETHGKATSITQNKDGKWTADSTSLFTDLRRPLQVSAADLNNDNKTDYLICEFGYLQGSLSWMENKGNNSFSKHVLRPFPGAIKAILQDYNHDGKMDIWVLFAQADEGIFLYTNKGN